MADFSSYADPNASFDPNAGGMSLQSMPTGPVPPPAEAPHTPQSAQLYNQLHSVTPPPAGVPGASPTVLDPTNIVSKVPLPVTSQSSSTGTVKGLAPSVLNPVLASNTATANTLATTEENVGAARSARARDSASAQMNAADTGMRQSAADEQDKLNEQEDARKQELVLRSQTDPEIDPNRYMRSLSTGQTLSLILLAAVNGAFKQAAAGTGHEGGNDVLQLLNQRNDQDIRAQQAQIESGRIRRGNMIAFYMSKGLDAKQAAVAAKAMNMAQAERYMTAQAAFNGSPEAMENAQIEGAKIRAQTQAHNDELRLTLGADRTQTSSSTTRAPSPIAGGAGTLDAVKKAVELDALLEKQGHNREQRQKTLEALGLPLPNANMPTEAEAKTAAANEKSDKDQREAQAADESIRKFALSYGLVEDPKTKQLRPGSAVVSPALTEALAGGISGGSAPAPITANLDAAVEAYGRLHTRGALTPELRAQYRHELGGGSMTQQQVADRLNAARLTYAARGKPGKFEMPDGITPIEAP